MIEIIFTIDYEIYGNGEGSLEELVYKPAKKMKSIFDAHNSRFVVFAEVAELEIIEAEGTDRAVDQVKQQLRDFYRSGYELGLHLHPQWYKAQYKNENWMVDYNEYNLCSLPKARIEHIVDRSIEYFRKNLGLGDFTPTSFRAGNWLFQPTKTVAEVLRERGTKVDSSVFKGGLQHQHKLDYRRALRNGHYWWFSEDVNVPEPQGALVELPIHTEMIPTWKMFTAKRVGLQRKNGSEGKKDKYHNTKKKFQRLMDFVRFRYPLKLDFCRMTINELRGMMDKVIKEDQKDSTTFKPIVVIGHTKDLVDFETVEAFLNYLEQKQIKASTFEEVCEKCK